mgnify:CR=1 FL=1
MKLIKLQVKGISYSETQTGAYALLLGEVEGDRKLPIIIGGFEAQAIAVALALRFSAPIYTYDSILKKAGFTAALSAKENKKLSEDNWIQNFVTEQTKKNAIPKNLKKMSVDKLKDLLNKLVALEDYEQAVRVRDELSKRKDK